MHIINIIVGIVLLTMGRKLFWLFIACIGFVFGYNLVAEAWTGSSAETQLIAGAAFGLVCALLAIFLQKLAIGIGGFIAGGYLAMAAMQIAGFQTTGLITILAVVVGGLIGILLMSMVFEGALVTFSALAGAAVILEGNTLSPTLQTIFFILMVIAGIAWQTRSSFRTVRNRKE